MPGPIAKPQLRGILATNLKRSATMGFAFAIAIGVLAKLFNNKRKENYLNFYKTYDAEADFERMKKAGVFQSVRPDGSVGEL